MHHRTSVLKKLLVWLLNHKANRKNVVCSCNGDCGNPMTMRHVSSLLHQRRRRRDESLRSRVAMDFTGPAGGRIVEDPLEARAVAAAEGCSWKRRWRPTQRKQPPPHHILALASANNTAVVQPMMMQQQQNNHRTTASQQQQQNNYNSMSPPANQHNQQQQHAYQHQQHRNDSPAHNQQQQNQTDLYNSSGPTTTTTEQQQYFTTNSLHQGLQPQMSRGGGGGEHVSRHQQRQMSLSPNGGVGYNSQYGGSSTNQQNLSHLSKPWFHVGVTREQAAAILLNRQQRPTGDGIFLVRESRSSPTRGHFVLTYRHSGRACHAHIRPMAEPLAATTTNTNATNTAAPNHHSHHSHPHGQQQYHQHGGGNNQQQQQQQQTVTVYSLDGGNTKFYDLQQLVEFYQLNAGTTLPVRLTHYVSRDDNNCLTFQQQNGAGGGVMTTPGSF